MILGWMQSTQGLISPPKTPIRLSGWTRSAEDARETCCIPCQPVWQQGLSEESRRLKVVIEGGRPGRSEGLTLSESAAFLNCLGCRDAIELDMFLRKANTFRIVNCNMDRINPTSPWLACNPKTPHRRQSTWRLRRPNPVLTRTCSMPATSTWIWKGSVLMYRN